MGFFEAWGKSVKEGQTKGAEARRKAEGVFAKARDAVAAAIAEIEAQPLQFQSAGARDKLVELHVASRKLHRLMGGDTPGVTLVLVESGRTPSGVRREYAVSWRAFGVRRAACAGRTILVGLGSARARSRTRRAGAAARRRRARFTA